MEALFEWLSALVGSTLWLALAGAFLWGVLSILLSPCHLTSIPLIVGYISQGEVKSVKRAFLTALAFSLGILLTIGLIGLITALMGRMMGDIGKWGNYLVAAIFVLVGLYLLDILKFNFPGLSRINSTKKGPLAALGLGLIFGIALGPCTFAFMAPVLAITLFSPETGFWHDVALLSSYGVGHCLVIVLAGTFTGMIQKYLNWNQRSSGTVIVKKICGVLIIIGGIYLLLQ